MAMQTEPEPELERDQAEARRLRHVRPAAWCNPQPASKYDLVVLGGGTAGLVAAMGAAGLGARVALVERHLLGGDCLNTGCVPSKALIRSARVIGELRKAPVLGVEASEVRVDFAAVMQRLRRRRAEIASHDSAAGLHAAHVDVFFGEARFADPATVTVDGASLRFRRALIATGGRPTAPPIPGLDTIPYLTNESIFVVDDETDGFVRVHHERGRIRGCTIVASHAGEVIAEAVYALTHGGTLGHLSRTIHPYPTQAEALRKAGDMYRRQALTPGVRKWLTRYFEWTR